MGKWICTICRRTENSDTQPQFCGSCYGKGCFVPADEQRITITDCGSETIKVMKIIREATGWSLGETKVFVGNLPATIIAPSLFADELRKYGATVTVEGGQPARAAGGSDAPFDVGRFVQDPYQPEAAKRTEPAPARPKAGTVSSWSSWDTMPVGHWQAVTALSALRTHTDRYVRDLLAAKEEWTKAKESSQKIYDTLVTSANRQCEDQKRQFSDECTRSVQATEKRRSVAQGIASGCRQFLTDMPKSGASGAVSAAQSRIQAVEADNTAVQRALSDKIAAYRNLYNLQVAEAERIRNEKRDKARAEMIERDGQSERGYTEKRARLCEQCTADIEQGFNKSAIQGYRRGIESSRFNAENYECATMVPEYVMLGQIGLTIPDTTQESMSVVQAVERQASDVGTKGTREYVVTIPYAQRLSDGISLLMRYTPEEKVYVKSLIQPLLMKLFLSFPAGKLEATMIDPLDIGASFPDIPKFGAGPNSARIIDTKIWSSERDIEHAIATMRLRLENITQAYGTDHASRLKKEAIRALAITDFPVGFSNAALKDLHAIVRNSASLGVCVLICANDTELEKLKSTNATLVAEILQNMVETKVSGGKLMLVGQGLERMFLKIDDMKDVMRHKDTIIPIMSDAIEHSTLKIERFESMYPFDIYDSNNWFMGNHDEIAIPLGIKGADTIVKMVLGRGGGSTEHHALIAGLTGAGKSTLLHTLILSTLISYSPDEVQMYLLDFKEGVEFSAYTRYRLPSLRAVAIHSEREFGLNVLKELCNEIEIRSKHFTRYGAADINGYSKLPDVPKIPKLLLIFDEVQELFRTREESDSISRECLSCINRLVMQGRAMGIHIILACQDFHNCSGLEAYFTQMAIRIAVKGSETAASSILDAQNSGISALQSQPAGAAIYNGGCGVESANNFFQVSYINEEQRISLDAYFTDPDVAPLYRNMDTRILLTNMEDNIRNCFTRLIREGKDSIEPLGQSRDGYGMLLGQGFGKKSTFVPELRVKPHDNLLVVTRDEKMALSIFELAAMSVLYEELHTDADKANALVYMIDLSECNLFEGECDLRFLRDQFPQQLEIARKGDMADLVRDLYETVVARSEGSRSCAERIFLLFFGIDRARILRNAQLYENDVDEELSPLEMLQKVVSIGPKYGVNSIIWSEHLEDVQQMLGDRYGAMFNKRIAFGLNDDAMSTLVEERDNKAIRGKTAVYMDVIEDNKNTHFRPYDVPSTAWIREYGEAYNRVITEGGM